MNRISNRNEVTYFCCPAEFPDPEGFFHFVPWKLGKKIHLKIHCYCHIFNLKPTSLSYFCLWWISARWLSFTRIPFALKRMKLHFKHFKSQQSTSPSVQEKNTYFSKQEEGRYSPLHIFQNELSIITVDNLLVCLRGLNALLLYTAVDMWLIWSVDLLLSDQQVWSWELNGDEMGNRSGRPVSRRHKAGQCIWKENQRSSPVCVCVCLVRVHWQPHKGLCWSKHGRSVEFCRKIMKWWQRNRWRSSLSFIRDK